MEEFDTDAVPQVHDMVSFCAGLVTVDEESNVIRLVHYTTQEYFESKKSDWFPKAESMIATICITYLSFKDLEESRSLYDDHRFAQSYEFFEYAVLHWGRHAYTSGGELGEITLRFLTSEKKTSIAGGIIQEYTDDRHFGPSDMVTVPKYMIVNDVYLRPKVTLAVTGLHLAAYFGLREAVEALLKNGWDVNVESDDIPSPLYVAVRRKHEDVIKTLIDNGATFGMDKDGGVYYLNAAVYSGIEAIVKIFLEKGADVEPKAMSENAYTPLITAVEEGHVHIVRLLLDKGINIEAKSILGETSLFIAASTGHEGIVQLLLEHGANIEAENQDQDTPLLKAVSQNYERIVQQLLEQGANTECKDGFGNMPLLLAIEEYRISIIRLLLEKGADTEAKSTFGVTPLLYAVQLNFWGKLPYNTVQTSLLPRTKGYEKETQEIITLLLEYGAAVDTMDRCNWTPLFYAVSKRNKGLIEMLLDKGASINATDNVGRTPLSFAIEAFVSDNVGWMPPPFAIDEYVSEYGPPPQQYTLSENIGGSVKEIITLLLGNGADIEVMDATGRTPLSYALEGHGEKAKEMSALLQADRLVSDLVEDSERHLRAI